MRVERNLQFSMALLAAMGTLLLGIGERNLLLPAAATVLAIGSVYLTDITGWLRLNTTVANIAGLVALGASIWNWDRLRNDGQLVTMANLLVYLQFVLLYRSKTNRHYWMIVLLSLLQVAVAAAMSLSLLFGCLLVVYILLGLVTLCLFFLYREQARYGVGDKGFVGVAPIAAGNAGVRRAFLWQVAALGMATLGTAVVVFAGVPRMGRAAWRPFHRGASVVGFTPSVTLGELGEVLEDPAEVMRVQFVDMSSGGTYPLAFEPLLRGCVLTRYESGTWHRPTEVSSAGLLPDMSDADRQEDQVRQIYTVQPLNSDVLFCVYPPADSGFWEVPLYSPGKDQLFRPQGEVGREYHYSFLAPGLRNFQQSAVTPAMRQPTAEEYQQLLQLPSSVGGKDPLAALREIAATLSKDFAPSQRMKIAAAMQFHLRDSHQFNYSLGGVERDPSLDPVEDFLVRHRSGHCEYFASALALLLRASGVPARVVVGFKGGDFNTYTRAYHVQQLHAHTWVEVYLEPDDDVPEEFQHRVGRVNGWWLRLDPTPSADESNSATWTALDNVANFSEMLWSNYVLGLDAQRQSQVIYQPLARSTAGLFSRALWQSLCEQFLNLFRPSWWRMVWNTTSKWQLALDALGVALLVYFMRRSWRSLRAVARRRRERRVKAHRESRASQVGFYARLETLFESHGLPRSANSTPREFSVQAARWVLDRSAANGHGQAVANRRTPRVSGLESLRHEPPLVAEGMERATPADVEQLTKRIVDAFYLVRFGRQHLDEPEALAVEQALSQLANVLQRSEVQHSEFSA